MVKREEEIPPVEETPLDREDLLQAAAELDVDATAAEDEQDLLERLGEELGEVERGQDGDDRSDEDAEEAGTERPEQPEAQSGGQDEALGADEPRGEERERNGEDDEQSGQDDEQRNQSDEQPDADREQDGGEDDEQRSQGDEQRDEEQDGDDYRPEDDPREGVRPLLDVSLGPVALDVLGLEVHLRRIHLVLNANSEPGYAAVGKLLTPVAAVTNKLGLNRLLDTTTTGLDKLLGVLPSPDVSAEGDGSGEGEGSQEEGGDGQQGLLSRAGSAASGIVGGGWQALRQVKEAATSAKDAAVDTVTPGGKGAAAKEATDVLRHGKAAVDAATGD